MIYSISTNILTVLANFLGSQSDFFSKSISCNHGNTTSGFFLMVQGMFNGNIGITKAVIVEITNASNIAQCILAHFLHYMCSVCIDWNLSPKVFAYFIEKPDL
jgi:hypothetical protein